jgi:hypothetical protein
MKKFTENNKIIKSNCQLINKIIMEATSENTSVTNDQYSFEVSSGTTAKQPDQDDNFFFDELYPAKLFISDIIY